MMINKCYWRWSLVFCCLASTHHFFFFSTTVPGFLWGQYHLQDQSYVLIVLSHSMYLTSLARMIGSGWANNVMRIRNQSQGIGWTIGRRRNSLLSWTVWGKDEGFAAVVVSKRSRPGASEGGPHCMKSASEANTEKRDQETPGPC